MKDESDFMRELTDWPELVLGLVGPIGVNMTIVEQKLKEALTSVGYNPQPIRLTALMSKIVVNGGVVVNGTDPVSHYKSRIAYANAVRKKCDNDAALAALAVDEIRNIREAYWKGIGQPENAQNRPIERNAYILRQLKRSEEIVFLRKIYGRKFI